MNISLTRGQLCDMETELLDAATMWASDNMSEKSVMHRIMMVAKAIRSAIDYSDRVAAMNQDNLAAKMERAAE